MDRQGVKSWEGRAEVERIINKELLNEWATLTPFTNQLYIVLIPTVGRGRSIGIFRNLQNLHVIFSKLFSPCSSWSLPCYSSPHSHQKKKKKEKRNFVPALDISPLYYFLSCILTSWWIPILNATLLSLIHTLLHSKTWCHPRWLQHSTPGCTVLETTIGYPPLRQLPLEKPPLPTLLVHVITMTCSIYRCCSLTIICTLLDFLASPLECKVSVMKGTVFAFVFSPFDPQHPCSVWHMMCAQ